MSIFVAIEGVDCAGKFTTAKKLASALKHTESLKDTPVHIISFPIYETNSGQMLRRYLNGDYAENEDLTTEDFFPMLYSMNRLEFFRTAKLDPKAIYIFDRYVASNLIHQASNLRKRWLDEAERSKQDIPSVLTDTVVMNVATMSYTNWSRFEFNNGVPKIPNHLNFMLTIDIDTAMERLARRKNGKHEGADILESRDRIQTSIDFIEDYRTSYKGDEPPFTYIDVCGNDPTKQIYDAVMEEVDTSGFLVSDSK